MGYSFYGGRKGNGIEIVADFASGTNNFNPTSNTAAERVIANVNNILANVNYGEYCLIDGRFLYQRVLAPSSAEELRYIGALAQSVSVTNNYNLPFDETSIKNYKSGQ